MSFFDNVLGRGRVRRARRQLAQHPTPMNYAQLAYEHACQGSTREALTVCQEGLDLFPGSSELSLMSDRVRRLFRESRVRELREELADAPRPALWQEMCEVLLESGQIGRAEECALEWLDQDGGNDARMMIAAARVRRFLADRGREAGRRAFDALEDVQSRMPQDPRPYRERLQLCWRIGAWRDARDAASRLLQLEPGDPALEARFRTLESFAEGAPGVEEALRTVERTGRLADDKSTSPRPRGDGANVRSVLRDLAAEGGVRAALYLRGGTCLVQGPKGATAERTARAARQVLQGGRAAARKLGLGQVNEFVLEGEFGTLTLAPGEADAGCVWTAGPPTKLQVETITSLAGLDAVAHEVEA